MTKVCRELTPEEIVFSIPEETVRRLRNLKRQTGVIIGQERAVCAIDLGLSINAPGYNIYIMGSSGTGRRTVLASLLEKYKVKQEDLQDIVYVYNFNRPLEPKALFFPSGKGAAFKKDVHIAVESARTEISQLVKSDAFSKEREAILRASDEEESKRFAQIEMDMMAAGFKLTTFKEEDSSSWTLIPLIKGKPVSFEILENKVAAGKMTMEALNGIREKHSSCIDTVNVFLKKMREERRGVEKQIKDLRVSRAKPFIEEEFARLCGKYKDTAEKDVLDFLNEVRDDLIAHSHLLSANFKSRRRKKDFFNRYEVNLFCDHSPGQSCIIEEKLPTFANLFGSIDQRDETNPSLSDAHLRLRAGAVHRAFGGFLILRAQDVLSEDGVWGYLKRVLQSGKIEIQNSPTSIHPASLIKPQPLGANFKVVITGGEDSYGFLYNEAPDFQKLFKVCAEFDDVVPLSDTNILKYIAFIEGVTKKAGLANFTDAGLARLLKEAARMAGSRTKLSSVFTRISDLIYEANYRPASAESDVGVGADAAVCAAAEVGGEAREKDAGAPVTAENVADAVNRRNFMYRLAEERYSDRIARREIIIEVAGSRIGKVNGLAVVDYGYYCYGLPQAVTAQAGPGEKGIINIEGEAGLSGEIYDKAHLIIQGLLSRKYARNIPLFLTASVCFEQSYNGIDGDSASCAEFFALVSAITQIPLEQGIAVTGSLNQLGDVQPVGGIPQKIDGFFEACSVLGLSGSQGVIIPRRNMDDLILSDRVEKAIVDRKFHIWAVDTVEEGLEILSGRDSSEISIKMQKNLEEYALCMKKPGK